MTDAFTRATAALHADPNLSRPVTYTPAAARSLPATECRAVFSGELRADAGPGLGGAITQARTCSIALAALAYQPARGDAIIDGDNTWRLEAAERDIEQTQWSLTLSRT